MTNREFLEMVVNNETINADMIAYAKERLAVMDARNAERRNKPSKTAKENMPIKENILKYLKINKPLNSPKLAELLGYTSQRISSLCRQLVEDNKIFVADVKMKKKGKLKFYSTDKSLLDELVKEDKSIVEEEYFVNIKHPSEKVDTVKLD